MNIRIHPSIGVARLGNSPEGKLLVPNKIGGLPHHYNLNNLNQYDNIDQTKLPSENFKDEFGLIKRQGQPFRIYDEQETEITLDYPDVEYIEWTVHLANKKAEWYEYHELQGNLLYPQNSYKENGKRYTDGVFPLRNKDKGKIKLEDRRVLILDTGSRSIVINKNSNKQAAYFTSNGEKICKKNLAEGKYGTPINTLGEIHTDEKGRLIIFGGHGHTCGEKDLAGYGGGDTWYDDISDGSVVCKVTFKNGSTHEAKGWCIVGSPDFAPEIVNISTLYDTMLDLGIHNFKTQLIGAKEEKILKDGKYNNDYITIYERDIHPLFERMARYQWVGNVQPMANFGLFTYDHKLDVSALDDRKKEAILKNRKTIYDYFRQIDGFSKNDDGKTPRFDEEDTRKFYHESDYNGPLLAEDTKMRDKYPQDKYPQEYLFKDHAKNLKTEAENEIVEFGNLFPLMPLNSGSSSPRNENPLKFVSLTETQVFLLKQWSEGKCISLEGFEEENQPYYKDSISIGNCIGLPMSPGIEVTWSVHNPAIYDGSFSIKHAEIDNNLLTLTRDECEGGGCEPGDLTKRMACPWQADFINCSLQTINFSNPAQNRHYVVNDNVDLDNAKIDEESIVRKFPAPIYYTYWWPAQSPWEVIVGDFTIKRQIANGGFEAGRQMLYQRGINSYEQMVNYWDTLGFIRDVNYKNAGFPYIVETERNHEFFTAKKLTVGEIMHTGRDKDVEIPVFYIEDWKANMARIKQKGKGTNEEAENQDKQKSITASILSNPLAFNSENKIVRIENENTYKEYKKKLIESIKSDSLKNLGSDSRR